MNEGAFQFTKLHVDRSLLKLKFKNAPQLSYIGRQSLHSFATGSGHNHKLENKKLWEDFEKAIYQ